MRSAFKPLAGCIRKRQPHTGALPSMYPEHVDIDEAEKQIALLTDAYRSYSPIQFYGQTVHVVGFKIWHQFERFHFCFELSNRSQIIINQ